VVAKYHTRSGDVNEPIVEIIVTQIEESLQNNTSEFKAVSDFRIFLTKVARYRLLCLTLYSFFQQWNGGSIITYCQFRLSLFVSILTISLDD
jgi:hypothetical protein